MKNRSPFTQRVILQATHLFIQARVAPDETAPLTHQAIGLMDLRPGL